MGGKDRRDLRACRRRGVVSSRRIVSALGRLTWHCASTLQPQSGRLAVSARRRRLNDDRLTGVYCGRVAALEFLDRTVFPAHCVLPRLAVLAARKAEWRHDAMAGE